MHHLEDCHSGDTTDSRPEGTGFKSRPWSEYDDWDCCGFPQFL